MIILCGDDFALSDGVSRAIGDLCQARRLSAASALVTAPDWPRHAVEARALRPVAAIGLHLNLTLGRPLVTASRAAHLGPDGAFLPLAKLVLRALAGRLEVDAICRECSCQIQAFRDATGALPDFIDGHQHVHALPIVRDGVLAAIAEHDWLERPLVRVPAGGGARGLKAAAVGTLARGFAGALDKAGLPRNATFAGFSSFAVGSDYHRELEAALAAGGDGKGHCHLVMCHPGHVDDGLRHSGDALVERRQEEFDALMAARDLPARIWHPERNASGAIDWARAMTQ